MPWWGADGPRGTARVPVFVLTHDMPQDPPTGGVYTFVTGGIEQALEQAKAAAGDKDVTVMGGADTGQQSLRAGLVEELDGAERERGIATISRRSQADEGSQWQEADVIAPAPHHLSEPRHPSSIPSPRYRAEGS